MSLSLVLCAKRRLFRETETPTTTFSLLSLSLSFRSRRKDNEACVCPRRFPRACVQIRRPTGKFNPQKLCALSLSCTSLETERRTRNVAREFSLSLSTVSQRPRISPGRVFASVKRERNDPKFVRKLLLFFLSFILQLSARNFHRWLARAKRRRAARSFFSNPTHTGRRRRRRR